MDLGLVPPRHPARFCIDFYQYAFQFSFHTTGTFSYAQLPLSAEFLAQQSQVSIVKFHPFSSDVNKYLTFALVSVFALFGVAVG